MARGVSTTPIRLFLVHGRRLVGDAVVAALRREPGLRVAGRSGDAETAAKRLRVLGVDVVLVDASDHSAGAAATIQSLREAHPALKLLAFGVFDGGAGAVRLAEAGASGCVAREAAYEELVGAVRALHRDHSPCPPEVTAVLVERIRELDRARGVMPPPGAAELTSREREVLGLLADGRTNKEIAHALEVAVPTVKNHVHSVLGKLGARRRQDAVRLAYLCGLVESFLPPGAESAPGC